MLVLREASKSYGAVRAVREAGREPRAAAGKITGKVLNVDGGAQAAHPR